MHVMCFEKIIDYHMLHYLNYTISQVLTYKLEDISVEFLQIQADNHAASLSSYLNYEGKATLNSNVISLIRELKCKTERILSEALGLNGAEQRAKIIEADSLLNIAIKFYDNLCITPLTNTEKILLFRQMKFLDIQEFPNLLKDYKNNPNFVKEFFESQLRLLTLNRDSLAKIEESATSVFPVIAGVKRVRAECTKESANGVFKKVRAATLEHEEPIGDSAGSPARDVEYGPDLGYGEEYKIANLGEFPKGDPLELSTRSAFEYVEAKLLGE